MSQRTHTTDCMTLVASTDVAKDPSMVVVRGVAVKEARKLRFSCKDMARTKQAQYNEEDSRNGTSEFAWGIRPVLYDKRLRHGEWDVYVTHKPINANFHCNKPRKFGPYKKQSMMNYRAKYNREDFEISNKKKIWKGVLVDPEKGLYRLVKKE